MKTIPSLRRHRYLRSIGILLIATALVAGILSCNGGDQYYLMITSTDGGVVTDPGEGIHSYAPRAVVPLVATPDCGHVFDVWSGDTANIDDINAASTNITMSANYNITANFKPIPPDHYKFYMVGGETKAIGEEVQLEDQFGTFNATVTYADAFGNPVEKGHPGMPLTPISDENRHYTVYWLDFGEGPEYQVSRSVEVKNQFQENVVLTVLGPAALAVPTQKEGHEMVECLNHFLLYWVLEEEFPEESVNLKDQFIPDGEDVTVWGPSMFGNPVKKTVVESGKEAKIYWPDEHWVLYDIGADVPSIDKTIQINNQFGNQTLDLTYMDTLAVPSEKISWEKPLSHFHFYWSTWAAEPPMYGQTVLLEDQFIADWLHEPLSATVEEQVFFANPAEKEHEAWTPVSDWNDHLACYNLSYEEHAPVYYVEISNQFDPLEEPYYQWFYVQGPEMLAVPTQKFPHDPPGDLDHYTLYRVLSEPPVLNEPIWVFDQFTSYSAKVWSAAYLAVPVKKTLGAFTAPIKNPDDHLMLYWMDGGKFWEEWLPINNQFGPQILAVWQDEYEFLGVPSQKLKFSIPD